MGKWFGVALLDNGKSGTLFYDEEPKAGDTVRIWQYDAIGNPVPVDGAFLRCLR